MNRRGSSGYDIWRERVFIICRKQGGGVGGVVEENSVRGSFASSYEIDGMEGSMGATLTWS